MLPTLRIGAGPKISVTMTTYWTKLGPKEKKYPLHFFVPETPHHFSESQAALKALAFLKFDPAVRQNKKISCLYSILMANEKNGFCQKTTLIPE